MNGKNMTFIKLDGSEPSKGNKSEPLEKLPQASKVELGNPRCTGHVGRREREREVLAEYT